jgi:hypothetical protein
MAGSAGQRQPLEADALFAQDPEIPWIAVQAMVEMLQGKCVPLGSAQRLSSFGPGLRPKGGDRRLVRQHQEVPNPPCPAGELDPVLPGIVLLPKFAYVADAQRPPVWLPQVRHQMIDWAHLATVPGVHCGLHHVDKLTLVVLKRRRVGRAVLHAVAQLPVGVEVEGGRDFSSADDHDASCAQGMAHAEFVPDVGIVDAQIRDHEVGDEQFLEHVGADITGAHLLVGPEGFQTCCRQHRPDVLVIHAVEIDHLAIYPGLGAEGHDDECMR